MLTNEDLDGERACSQQAAAASLSLTSSLTPCSPPALPPLFHFIVHLSGAVY